MKNLIITVGIITLTVIFMSFQKDLNALKLHNKNLQSICDDSVDYISCILQQNEKISDSELRILLSNFLDDNNYLDELKYYDVHIDYTKKKVKIELNAGERDYCLDFLNNERDIIKISECSY